MTKLRDPLTYKATLANVASHIGWDRCAEICGAKSGETVRLWSDPDCKTEIRMTDAEKLDLAFIEQGGDHAPFNRLMSLRLDLLNRPMPNICARRLSGQIATLSGAAVEAFISHGLDPSPKTRRHALAAGEAVINALRIALTIVERSEREVSQ